MDRKRTTSPSHRHLAAETVMRIEVSLSSRKSSVVVFNTTARLVVLGKGEWSSIAYGAPCIVLLKETTAPDSPFQVKFAIAELESGIALWEEEITPTVQYTELQPGFHSFVIKEQTMAVQFADPSESASFHDSLVQYMAQKERTDELLQERKKKSPTKTSSSISRRQSEKKASKKDKKRNSFDSGSRRFTKIDISQPCEFRHLSGITSGHTDVCQKELEGTIQRQHRSASLGAISQKNTKQRGRIPEDMTDGLLYRKKERASEEEEQSKQKQVSSGSNRGKFTFRSLRMTKKKPLIEHEDAIAHQSKDDSSIGGSPKHVVSLSGATPQALSSDEDNTGLLTNASPLQSESSSPAINPSPTQDGGVPLPHLAVAISNGWENNPQVSPSRRFTAPAIHTQLVYSPKKPEEPQLHSPQRAPLQPLTGFQQHSKFGGGGIKKQVNTYDMLEPLDSSSKLKTQLSPPGQLGAPNLVSQMTPLHQTKQQSTDPLVNKFISSPTLYDPQQPAAAVSPLHNILPTGSSRAQSVSPTRNAVRSVSPQASSGGDLDQLTMELSKVLKDFDELIAPQSPFMPSNASKFVFQPPSAGGKETMV